MIYRFACRIIRYRRNSIDSNLSYRLFLLSSTHLFPAMACRVDNTRFQNKLMSAQNTHNMDIVNSVIKQQKKKCWQCSKEPYFVHFIFFMFFARVNVCNFTPIVDKLTEATSTYPFEQFALAHFGRRERERELLRTKV